MIKTAAAERVVAPTAAHLCHLVLLCERAKDPEQFTQLEGVAQAVAKATKNMAAVASRYVLLFKCHCQLKTLQLVVHV